MFRQSPQTRIDGVQTVFCDESGHTGNNLADTAQPLFVYAAVAIDNAEAASIIGNLASRIQAQGTEVKASTLLRTARGRRAIADVIEAIGSRSAIQIVNKRFALACKFFEYIFEPALQANSGFFYARNFHKFVANLLYVTLAARDLSAERTIAGFQNFMRTRDDNDLKAFLGMEMSTKDSPWRAMSDFAVAYKSDIADELSTLQADNVTGKWVLDLSSSTLFRVLSDLGDRYEQLDVFCDESKPLKAYSSLINTMVGVKNDSRWVIGDTNAAVTFNLARPIQLVESKSSPGIQVADFLASAVAYAVKEPDQRATRLIELRLSQLNVLPVEPEYKHIDLKQEEVVLNTMLLRELHDRALRGDSPLDHIEYSYEKFKAILAMNPGNQNSPFKSFEASRRKSEKIRRNDPCPCNSSRKYKRCCGSAR